MRLRPRQTELVDRALAALAERRNTLAVAPTGAGKTIMLSAVGGEYSARIPADEPNKVLILQHRDELVSQNAKKFRAVNPSVPISIFDAESKSWSGRAVFGMVQTLSRPKNLSRLPPFGLVIVDEAHHSTAASYMNILAAAHKANPKVAVAGFTATPNRGDGTPLRDAFDNVCDQITIGELIASGHLVRPRTFTIDVGATAALGTVRKLASDFDMAAVAAIMDRTIITDAVIAKWREYAGDRQTIVFCSTVAHAQHVCEAFVASGVKAEIVEGNTPGAERAAILARYRKGTTQVIINVAVLTEGFDDPLTACVILLRPSSYKSTMVQMIGRGLRPVDPAEFPGIVKMDCVVLDFGTSSLTHGKLEEDANLDGRPATGEAPMKSCPGCEGSVPISTMECPLCGFQWERQAREKTDLHDFVLTEIDMLARSNFKWIDIWGDDHALMAAGFDAWAGLFWWQGLWHAIGGTKTELRHLGVGERMVALALGDDFLNAHEDGGDAHKTKRWLREPASDKQLAALGLPPLAPNVTKYQAMCRLSFRFNKRAIQGLVTTYNRKEAA